MTTFGGGDLREEKGSLNIDDVGERGDNGVFGDASCCVDFDDVSFPFLTSLDCDADDDDVDDEPDTLPFILLDANLKTRDNELAKSEEVPRELFSESRDFVFPPTGDVTFGCVGDGILPSAVGFVGDVASFELVTSSFGLVGDGGSELDRERRSPLMLLDSSRQALVSDDIFPELEQDQADVGTIQSKISLDMFTNTCVKRH